MVNRRSIAFAAWLLLAAIFVFTDGPIYLRPETGFPNLDRFAGLCFLGLVFCLAYPTRWLASLGFLIIAVCAFEYLQHFVHYRHGTIHDAVIKCAGVIAGYAIAKAFDEIYSNDRIEVADILD
jgi:glycopeptide antibiotics resistance protein